ncbi:conserved hypothetical protein [Sporisorium reilianum SRZ2]|uniref:Glycosyltransferase family 69 protein n=1 Tax=Sporisorium reilianum (strain SRZ2) TaxID=999809 RepID=E6ZSM9_SPORE|nr:conserved hypothetical protein [Sporisorium reilianum SRZ2]
MSLCPRAAAQALGSPNQLEQHEYKHSAAYFDGHDQEPLLESQLQPHAASSTATTSPSRKAWLPVLLVANLTITVTAFIAACIHFNTFTTLLLYLALLIVAFPILSLSLFVLNHASSKYNLKLPDFSPYSTPLSEQSFADRSSTGRNQNARTRRRSCRTRHLLSLARTAQYVGAVLWFLAIVEWIFFQPILASGSPAARDEIASFIHASPSADARPAQPIKVFIASNLYNSQEILPSFSSSLKSLIQILGTDNVSVSIYESHSTDQTKPMLAKLDEELAQTNVSRRILSDDQTTRKDKLSAVADRIDFLAQVRNTAMQPLVDAADKYTHVLWINDVVFAAQDALELLHTNHARYDQACAMDFIGNGFYDTWVTRDVEGETLKRQWPYFKRVEDVEAMRRGKPFEVNSCWNGMSAFDAKWFYPSANSTLTAVGDEEGLLSLPLRFRSSATCPSSECQLISYDMHRALHPTARRPTILINPAVNVAYTHRHYFLYNSLLPSPLLRPWRIIWRDWIAFRTFGWLTEGTRWPNECRAKQKLWAPAVRAASA